jgi:hypothetical protein
MELEGFVVPLVAIMCGAFVYFEIRKSKSREVAGVLSIVAMMSGPRILFMFDFIPFSPLKRYMGAYAALASVSISLIAEEEISKILKPESSDLLYDTAWFFLVLGSTTAIGLFLWTYDYVLRLPVDIYVILLPAFWVFISSSTK